MSLSHAYGTPPAPEDAIPVLLKALDLGYTHLDSAALYGFVLGANQTLLGQVLKHRWHEVIVATKGGMFRNAQGQREVDGRPEVIVQNCDESLTRLGIETIDLYYLHRRDKKVPIEDSVGALAGLVKAGKVKTIGLSEVSAATIRAAHAVHPITRGADGMDSLGTRNPEVAVLDTCKELGITVVAFSLLARGFLTGRLRSRSLSVQGHPAQHAALPTRTPAAQPVAARRAVGHRRASTTAPWARWRLPGCWRAASTSSRFRGRPTSST